MKENFSILRSGAAGSTLIAGILRLSLVAGVLDRNVNTRILFLIGGWLEYFGFFLLLWVGIKHGIM